MKTATNELCFELALRFIFFLRAPSPFIIVFLVVGLPKDQLPTVCLCKRYLSEALCLSAFYRHALGLDWYVLPWRGQVVYRHALGLVSSRLSLL